MWRFDVSDNGQGIEPQYRERIFVLFQRLHTRKESSGFSQARPLPMRLVGTDDGCALFEAVAAPGDGSGLHGYTVRVLPRHPDLASPFQSGLISWAPPNAAARPGG